MSPIAAYLSRNIHSTDNNLNLLAAYHMSTTEINSFHGLIYFFLIIHFGGKYQVRKLRLQK
jgi:hypothetical protein